MQKIHQLEGLRGIAALMVVYCHFILFFTNGHEEQIASWSTHFFSNQFLAYISSGFLNFFTDGELAVYIFWTMSAYVICINLFKAENESNLPAVFYKRYIRLAIPVLASVFFGYILLSFGAIQNQQVAAKQGLSWNHGWMAGMYTFEPSMVQAVKSAVWNAFFYYDGATSYNSVLWSMEKELWGSFFCFFLIAVFKRYPLRYYLYCIAFVLPLAKEIYWLSCFSAGLAFSDYHFNKNPSRDDLLSKLLTNIDHHFKKSVLVYVYMLALIIIGGHRNYYQWANVFISVGIVFIILQSQTFSRIFSLEPLVRLGKISFSIYLLHMPILCSLSTVLYLNHFPVMWNILISLVTIFVASILFEKFVDRKALVIAKKLK